MSATYNLFRNPGEKDKLHARQVNQLTIRIDELCEEISEISSFSSADVKGMLNALKSRIAFHLKYGDIVELEGLGTFNATLKCPSLSTEKQITPHLVKFNKVVFRCSNELKKELRYMKVERADEPSRLKGYTEEKRKANILAYIEKNNTISTFECRSVNGCSKYIALKDLKALLNEGRIVRLGYRSNAQYGLKAEEEQA
ncbi:HU family DNA-binding protein [Parabacteroides sp.]